MSAAACSFDPALDGASVMPRPSAPCVRAEFRAETGPSAARRAYPGGGDRAFRGPERRGDDTDASPRPACHPLA
jgi:hypothetical protein